MTLYRAMGRSLDAYSIEFNWWPEADRWYTGQKRYIESETSTCYGDVLVEMRSVVCGISFTGGLNIVTCFKKPLFIGRKGSAKKSVHWLWFELGFELKCREIPYKIVRDLVGDWEGKYVRDLPKQ